MGFDRAGASLMPATSDASADLMIVIRGA